MPPPAAEVDVAAVEAVPRDLAAWLDGRDGWRVAGVIPSPIEGGDGNREFLLAGLKDR